MEVAFVVSAIRRYAWVVILFCVLGLIPLLRSGGDGAPRYESRAVLFMAPPSEAQVFVSSASDPDRYIASQLSVLRSDVIADRAAQAIGDGATASSILELVEFEHVSGTDLVHVVVTTPNAALSQRIGDAYLDAYFEAVRERVDETQEPEINRLTTQLDDLEERIAVVDAQMAEVMRPFLPTELVSSTGDNFAPLPDIEQVAPNLVSERTLLLSEYEDILTQRTQLNLSARLRVSSEVVQRATLPTAPTAPERGVVAVLAPPAGLFGGILVAIVLARLSPRVLNEAQFAEIMRRPIAGALPYSQQIVRGDPISVRHVPDVALVKVLDGICVRAEANAPAGPFTVGVVGTRRGVGTTTVAIGLASRFAASGASVLILDGDHAHQDLRTKLAPELAPDRRIAPAPARKRKTVANAGSPGVGPAMILNRTAMDVDGVELASLGESADAPIRRSRVDQMLGEAMLLAEVSIIDGGPVMSSAATVHLARQADAVVLVVARHPRVRQLAAIADELGDRPIIHVWSGRRSLVARVIATLRARVFHRDAAAKSPLPAEPAASAAPDELVASAASDESAASAAPDDGQSPGAPRSDASDVAAVGTSDADRTAEPEQIATPREAVSSER